MTQSQDRGDNDSLPQTLKHLAEDLGVLVRKDLESARAEMMEKVKTAGLGAGMLSGSAVTAMLTLFSLTALAMVLLSAVVKLWIAVMLVTLFWAIVTGILALVGKQKIQDAGPPIPEETIAKLKDDIETAKREVESARK
ncbi:MAG: hypothetical protein DLM50_09115 [Candidatus Meridianibacter frigidus]|nr:MAG: hypothetical protein DLM50_09115 [Candidatus Eremiobacteraeota bacterium]